MLHKIHGLADSKVVSILENGLKHITDQRIVKNYHPDFANDTGNIFYLLGSGRYRKGRGAYFVAEEDGVYLGSGGWNTYDLRPSTALLLTRAYITPDYRSTAIIGHSLLKSIIRESWPDIQHFDSIWITVNQHNLALYKWFDKVSRQSTPLFSEWPEIQHTFRAIGQQQVYNTDQWVVELKANK